MLSIVAIIIGLLFSSYLTVVRLRQLMIVAYHLPFRFWKPYSRLYNGLESKYNYELLGGDSRFGGRHEYHCAYEDLRPTVTGQFNKLWDAYALAVGRSYGFTFAVSLALFWKVWWAFVVPFLLLQLSGFLFLYFAKKYHANFFASLMLSLLLDRSNVVKTTDDYIIRSELLL